ncbi:MAG: 16S rRNA (guanine(966)-N(2))-methyltransferase RsmD [Gammaproteobacteria bacterium]|nr:16S rRNA (guanine(966)-N(2))-methyltransferase RsmD [Gammaproteobacteria bacterium]
MASKRNGKVRIIAGNWRSRLLEVTDVDGLRPTGARVRETLFNWLQHDVVGARCLDLFAGTGALGFEGLSRGAAHCDFVDASRQSVAALQRNAAALGAGERGAIHCTDAKTWLSAAQAPYDLIFFDPPFAGGHWAELLPMAMAHLAEGGKLYVEAPKLQTIEMADLERLKHKVLGEVQVCLFARETQR